MTEGLTLTADEQLDESRFQDLRTRMRGEVLRPGDAG